MSTSRVSRALLVGLPLWALAGCTGGPTPSASGARPRISFDAARAKCGATVAESPQVQSCMRAQGWVYRLPWE